MEQPPETFSDLFKFYYDYVKLLYSRVQTTNQLPSEVLFEINAAFDHLSRHWHYGQSEKQAVEKAYSHLKRSCLDIFKLRVKEIREQYDELRKIDTSVLDNGKFDGAMRGLFAEITRGATEARQSEGLTQKDDDIQVKAFDLWVPVYARCESFEKDFYHHPHLDWAKKKGFRLTAKKSILSLASAVVFGAFIKEPLILLLKLGATTIGPYLHWPRR